MTIRCKAVYYAIEVCFRTKIGAKTLLKPLNILKFAKIMGAPRGYNKLPYTNLSLEDWKDKRVGILLENIGMQKGYVVDIAENGKETLERVDKNTYQLIFMDQRMPVMDETTAVALIRGMEDEKGERTPIIMLSADIFDIEDNQLGSIADDFFPKPIKIPQLLKVIRDHIKE